MSVNVGSKGSTRFGFLKIVIPNSNSSKSIFVFNKNIFFVRFDLSIALSEL